MTHQLKKCPQCGLAGNATEKCGAQPQPTGTCPGPAGMIPVDTKHDVVLTCATCEITMAVPIGKIMNGVGIARKPCTRSKDTCQAVVLNMVPKANTTGKVIPPPVL